MKIKLIKLLLSLTIVCFSITDFVLPISAASVGASAADNGNGTYTVYVSISSSSLAGGVTITSNGSSQDVWCEGGSCGSATFSGIGSISITVSPSTFTDMDRPQDGDVPVSGTSISITVKDPNASSNNGNSNGNSGGSTTPNGSSGGNSGSSGSTPVSGSDQNLDDTKSSDNSLSSLVVSKGTLDPVFDSAVTDYKLVLSADTTSLTIDATASDAKANISGTGEVSVNPGDNRLEILVTAENGSEKTYIINAYVDEKPDTFMKVNGKDYGVITNVDDVPAPYGFEKTTLEYNGKEIPVWKNVVNNLTLVYLINEKSEKNFYIFENNEVTSIYIPIALLGNNLAIIDIPEDMQNRKGMEFKEVEIDGQKMPGWTFTEEAFANYTLVYLMNEKGEKVFYLYEKQSNTLQPYSGAAAVTQDGYEALISQNFYWMVSTGVATVFAILFLILWLQSAKKNKHYLKKSKSGNAQGKDHVEDTLSTQTKPLEEPPLYHRQRSVSLNEQTKEPQKEADFGTQPFRFHDDFDDQELK